jgi:UDP-N-acetylmuramate--alanine ligase
MANIFFSGIGGSGMSSLACFAVECGHTVTGSDRLFDRYPGTHLASTLASKGIRIVLQDGEGIDSSFDMVVFSTAVEDDHPEKHRARMLRIPMTTRPEYLSKVISGYRTVAVAGTSGKSTIAGMLAYMMKKIGLEPNFIGGGRVKQFKMDQNPGNFLAGTSDILVVEACESDGSIIHYSPSYAIIANISIDHHSIEQTSDMFRALSANTTEKVFLNGDDPNLRRIDVPGKVVFTVDTISPYRATHIDYRLFKTYFRLGGVNFEVSLPGKHNLYNALSVIALLSELGTDLSDIASILPEFRGLDRRFDVLLNDGNSIVIDDYAHNPHKIASLMDTVKNMQKRICYIFQPHGYAPTRLMKKGYVDVFSSGLREDDHLILLPIYYAGGTTMQDISSEDLCTEVMKAGKSAETMNTRSDLYANIGKWSTYVILGARDETLSDFAREIARRLS